VLDESKYFAAKSVAREMGLYTKRYRISSKTDSLWWGGFLFIGRAESIVKMQISEIEAEKQVEEQREMEAESTRRQYEHVVKKSGKEGQWDVTGLYAINVPFIQQ
jgi:hypothetical protein